MRVGLDIDGVIADFTRGINENYETWFGQACPIVWDEWESYKMAPEFPSWSVCSAWADKARIWEHMKVIPGALAGIDRLLEQGHQLSFLTARSSAQCVSETRFWFQREISDRFGLSMDRLYTGLAGSKATIPCSVYVDDGPHELAALKGAGKSTIRYRQAWNKGCRATATVNDWKGLTNLIGELEA